MLIPSVLYGSYKEVKACCNEVVMRLKKGQTWDQAMPAGHMTETAENSGLILLNAPYAALGKETNYQCYFPLSAIDEARLDNALPPDTIDAIFLASLQTPWGLLGLLSRDNTGWFEKDGAQKSEDGYRPFLRALLPQWDLLYGEGDRYAMGSTHGENLWDMPTNLHYVLANMGASVDSLREPLPPGGLPAFIQKMGIDLSQE